MRSSASVSARNHSLPWYVALAATITVALAFIAAGRNHSAQLAPLTPQEQALVLAYARERLQGVTPAPLPERLNTLCGKHVFVHLFQHSKLNYLYGVSDVAKKTPLCLPSALDQTVERLKETRSWEAWRSTLGDARVGVSIRTTELRPARLVYAEKRDKMNAIERHRIGWRLHSNDFSIGHHGLFIQTVHDSSPQRHWAPPIEGVARAHGREDNQVHLRAYTAHHLKKLGINRSDKREEKPEVDAFAYEAFLMLEPGTPGELPLTPIRGNLPVPRSDADQIWETATHLTDYLVRTMDRRGRFDYEYYADGDRSSREYNIVRHAGTTYSLLVSHNYTGDDRYLSAGLRAKDYMVANLKHKKYQALPYHSGAGSIPVPFPEPDGSIKLLALEMGGRASLGATALALLAFAQIPPAALESADAERIRQMVNFTWFLQCESGGFYSGYREALKGKCPDPQPLYYPGETLLALNTLYQVNPHPALLAIAEKSIGFELQRFYDGTWPDHWVMQALNLMQQNMPQKAQIGSWADAAREMADKYVTQQYMSDRDYAAHPPFPEFDGGHQASKGPPRNTPTGSRSEAIAGVWRLMTRTGDSREATRLGDHLLAAAHFIRGEMYRPENTYYLPDPEQALWGLRGSMIDPTVRIDFNQHALVGVWGAWEVAIERGGVGWPLPFGEEAEQLEVRARAGELITHRRTSLPSPAGTQAKPTGTTEE